VEKILNVLECQNSELSIVFVEDRKIRAINREYLGRDKPTNVISFSMQEGDFSGFSPNVLGDVIISCDTAAAEASESGVSFIERLLSLILHGILHLVGYDHERSGEAEARKMEKKEREILDFLRKEGIL